MEVTHAPGHVPAAHEGEVGDPAAGVDPAAMSGAASCVLVTLVLTPLMLRPEELVQPLTPLA